MRQNVSAQDLFTWLEAHNFVWYKAPMDIHPCRVWIRSKVRRWKRSPDRFEVTVEKPGLLKFRIDNSHLERVRIPADAEVPHVS